MDDLFRSCNFHEGAIIGLRREHDEIREAARRIQELVPGNRAKQYERCVEALREAQRRIAALEEALREVDKSLEYLEHQEGYHWGGVVLEEYETARKTIRDALLDAPGAREGE